MQSDVAYIYELVVVEGPLMGRSFRIEPHETLKIGRTCRDIPLFMDERASLEHAEITWSDGNGFWVRDLGSETGTFIDGRPLPEKGAALGVESLIRVGQTVMRLEERRGIPPWLGWSLAVGVPMTTILVVLIGLAVRGVVYEPRVVFATPIGQGGVTSEVAVVPESFLRRFGVDHRDLLVRRITDHDDDGRSELWFPLAGNEVVVEVDADAGWSVLGVLPTGCSDRPGLSFPDQLCNGVRYRWMEDPGPLGHWLPVQITSPIAWIPTRVMIPPADSESPPTYEPGPPRPFMVSLAHPGQLAGFLAERGVDEPIHYLLCEGAVAGVQAMVLTTSGRIESLSSGCIGQINTAGPGLDETVSSDDPLAVAFTANGYLALLQDVRTHAVGDPHYAMPALQLPDALAPFVERPEGRAVRLTFDGEAMVRNPIADEARLTGVRRWQDSQHGGAEVLTVASIDSPGLASFDPPGCAVLEVRTGAWHCLLRRWCTPASTFVTVQEVGCGEPRDVLSMGYGGGLSQTVVEGTEVWLHTDVYGFAGQIDVTRLRIGFRRSPPQTPSDAPELPGEH